LQLSDVLALCEKTPSWEGLQITNLQQKNHLGDTVLHTVCSWGDERAARAVIEAGVDIDAQGDNGASPLFNAVISESEDVLKLLLKKGANPNLRNKNGITVLEYARNTGASKQIIKLLSDRMR
jgi:ankyrin repeat protein